MSQINFHTICKTVKFTFTVIFVVVSFTVSLYTVLHTCMNYME